MMTSAETTAAMPATFGSSCGTDHGAERIVILSQPQNNAGRQLLAIVKRAP